MGMICRHSTGCRAHSHSLSSRSTCTQMDSKKLEPGSRSLYAGSPSLFDLGFEDGHVKTPWPLLHAEARITTSTAAVSSRVLTSNMLCYITSTMTAIVNITSTIAISFTITIPVAFAFAIATAITITIPITITVTIPACLSLPPKGLPMPQT